MMNSNKGFTLMNLIVIIVVLVLIVIGVIVISKISKVDKTYGDINNNATDTAKLRKSEQIVDAVELAYANAVLGDTTSIPTLDNIKSKFNVAGAKWTDKGIETNMNFNCDVDLTDNKLHVTCIKVETKRKMPFIN